MPGNAVELKDVSKRFGTTQALDRLDLNVAVGEVHGLLGPNGSGKSTALRILLGLLRRDSGQASLLGKDPWRHAVDLHSHLAYVPGEVNLWPNLSGGEAIDLLCRLRGGADSARIEEMTERFALDPTKKIRAYSKGNRQKVALISALAADVDLYLLDEPTSGFDPLMEAEFREAVRELKKEGKTVLLSSHILGEVEALCDRVTIIRNGSVVKTGTLSDLRKVALTSVTIQTSKPPPGLDALDGVQDVQAAKGHVRLLIKDNAWNPLLRLLARHDVKGLTSSPPSLEELFMEHYEGERPDTKAKADGPDQ